MKRALKIIKTYWTINASGFNYFYILFIIIGFAISGVTIFITIDMLNSIKMNYKVNYTGIFSQAFNLINFSTISIISFFKDGNENILKERNSNFNLFLTQLPVYKQDILNSRFIIFMFSNLPFMLIVMFLLVLNLFTGFKEDLIVNSGILLIIYVLWMLTISLSIAFMFIKSKRYKFFKVLPLIFPILICFILFYNVNKINTSYGYAVFLSRYQFVYKACIKLGGMTGVIVLCISILLSYYICCRLPLKISEKVG